MKTHNPQNPNQFPRDFYAITIIGQWPENDATLAPAGSRGPGFIALDGSRVYTAGFFPLFETRADAEKVAAAYPGATVLDIPISVVITDANAK